jgi:hypothetical protein
VYINTYIISYTYTPTSKKKLKIKYQGKTPLDYQHKVLKMKNRKVKQFLSGSGYSGSVEGIRKE